MASKIIVADHRLPTPAIPLSRAIKVGDLVFVSGTPASPNATTGQLDPDIRSQVSSALETIRTILDGAGTSLANVVAVTTYLKRAEDFEDYNDEYRKFFPSDFPTRTTVRCDLVRDAMLVEITVTAALPG
jgi:2-iminobutanoate/2-iminopropanoate deaminase